MNDYMCIFFDQLNFPISLFVEHFLLRKTHVDISQIFCFSAIATFAVILSAQCESEKFHFKAMGIVTGLLFNVFYTTASFLQFRTIKNFGAFGAAFRTALAGATLVTLFILSYVAFGYVSVAQIVEFYIKNHFKVIIFAIFYTAFYLGSVFHIQNFGVSGYCANLLSSSVIIVLVKNAWNPMIYCVLLLCIALIYILIRLIKFY